MTKPIVIIANYRTGSTAYSAILARQHNFIPFAEPHIKTEDFQKLYKLLSESGKNFVLKIMPDQIDYWTVYQEILAQDCYKIKLTRVDKVEQVASMYLARITNEWNSANPAVRGESYSVNIDDALIKNAAKYILDMDRLLDNNSIAFDEAITYESIEDVLESQTTRLDTKKLIAPSNYEELKQHTLNVLNNL